MTSTTDNHKNIIFNRSSKAKLGQGIGGCDDQFFRPWFRVCGTQSGSRPHPSCGKLLNRLAKGSYSFCITLMCCRRTAVAGSRNLSACSARSR
jgi:hypothetical protein